MPQKKMNTNAVLLELYTKATDDLAKEVEKDLQCSDEPQLEQARALLEDNTRENTCGHDGKSSLDDNSKNS